MGGNYIITEPSPSTTSYMRSGRGGAGNVLRGAPAPSSAPVPAKITTPARRFFTGVGGAGNAHKANERPTVSLDDEVRRLAREEQSIGHTGIGGAGNVYRRKASDASDATDNSAATAAADDDDVRSSFSSESSKSKLWARVSNTFQRD